MYDQVMGRILSLFVSLLFRLTGDNLRLDMHAKQNDPAERMHIRPVLQVITMGFVEERHPCRQQIRCRNPETPG